MNSAAEFVGDYMKNLLLSSSDFVFGLCVKRCNIRLAYGEEEKIDSDGFDLNQESALLPFSLVRILNKWGDYLYIKSHVGTGWVLGDCIAQIGRAEAKDLFFPEKFCIITDPEVSLCGESYYMSCKIPILGNFLKIPFIENGKLYFKTSDIKEGCHVGYIPFSRNTILSQAIKFLGTPYDWGEKSGGLDCSALLMYSFACCGIILPRSSSEQSKVTFPVSAYPAEEIERSLPADIIFRPGHVMLSLGDGFVIHASSLKGKVCISKI